METAYRMSPFTFVMHLLLVLSFCLIGCSRSFVPQPGPMSNALTGNWKVSSVSPAASKLPALSGELTGSSLAVSGIFHAAASGACVSPSEAISVSGHADQKNVLTLTGALAGGTITITGNVAEGGKSLTGAAYKVSGGSCAFTSPVAATAQAYSSVTGTYAGNFSDAGGQVIAITANLTQTPSSDTTGNFQLSGSGTFPNNPCFSSPVTVSNAQVTGGSFTLTYADPSTQNSVTATGTFATDASTLTVTNWTLTGSCGPDSGTGLLTRQP